LARLAREENEALKARIAVLEAKLGVSAAAPDKGSLRRMVIALSLGWEKLSGSAGYCFQIEQAWDGVADGAASSVEGAVAETGEEVSGIASVLKAETIDTALCHGWIDGQLDSFDDD